MGIATCVAPTSHPGRWAQGCARRFRRSDASRDRALHLRGAFLGRRGWESRLASLPRPTPGAGRKDAHAGFRRSDASRDRALHLRGAFIGRRGWESRLASLPRPTPDAGREDVRAGFRRSDASRDRATSHPARRKSRSRAAAATGVVEAARLQSRLASLPRPTPDAGREDARAGFRRSDASRDRATSHPARRCPPSFARGRLCR